MVSLFSGYREVDKYWWSIPAMYFGWCCSRDIPLEHEVLMFVCLYETEVETKAVHWFT